MSKGIGHGQVHVHLKSFESSVWVSEFGVCTSQTDKKSEIVRSTRYLIVHDSDSARGVTDCDSGVPH